MFPRGRLFAASDDRYKSATMRPVKRALAGSALVAVVLAMAFGAYVTRRERAYQDFIQRGDAALARGDSVAAVEAFSGAIALRADSMVAYLKRGDAYRRRGELESAVRDLRKAADLDPAATRPHELLGDVNLTLGRFARAAEEYEAYLALDDQSPRVLYKLGLARYRARQPGPCTAAVRQSLALDERFAEAHYVLGLCLEETQRSDAAIAALERSVALSPALLPAREELAELYGRLGRGDSHIAQLEALLALDPGPSREVTLGLAYARLGDSESAVTTLGRAARRHRAYGYTYVALGRVWLDAAEDRGDRIALGKALEALRSAARTDDSSEVLALLGRALLLSADVDAAGRTLQKACDKRPVDPLAFYWLADAAQRQGRVGAARQALLDYRALTGDERDARRRASLAARIADLSLRLNEPVAAVSWYHRAVAATPGDVDLLVRLAEAQLRAGNPATARTTLDRVLEKDPAHAAALALSRRIR